MLRSRFLWKLYASYAGLILLTTAIVGGLIARQIEQDSLSAIQWSLQARAVLLKSLVLDVFEGPEETGLVESELQERLQTLGHELDTRFTVIRLDGVVVADSEEDPAGMDNHGSRPEVLSAASGEYGAASRFSQTVGVTMMYLALPVRSSGQLVGYVRTSLPLSVIDERISQLRAIIVIGAGSAALVALLIGLVFARWFSAPLSSMTSVAQAMAQGDYDQRLSMTRSDEIGKLANALNQMAESARDHITELHRLEQIRRDFVANVSHELKTPIAAVHGLVETVIDDRKMTDENRKRFLAKIRNQSMRLSSIVTDLLTLSRVESGHGMLETESLDLAEVIRSTVTSLAQAAEERNIRVEVRLPEDPVKLLGDEDALSQVTSNLLDNALKYSPRDAEVRIRLQQENGKAVIEVQDRGVGIEPRDQDRIFERFYRVDKARSRELGGTGLGLSIVKHIVLAHGGEVNVESSPGAGSTFRVFLPVETSA